MNWRSDAAINGQSDTTMGYQIVRLADRGGPYDVAADELRQRFKADACMLIVMSGSDGTGFSVSGPDDLKPFLPSLFRAIAQEVEDALVTEQVALFCPECRVPLAFDPRQGMKSGDVPVGSIAVCAGCTSFLTLDDDAWRVLTVDELAEIGDDIRNSLTRTRREIQRRRRLP